MAAAIFWGDLGICTPLDTTGFSKLLEHLHLSACFPRETGTHERALQPHESGKSELIEMRPSFPAIGHLRESVLYDIEDTLGILGPIETIRQSTFRDRFNHGDLTPIQVLLQIGTGPGKSRCPFQPGEFL